MTDQAGEVLSILVWHTVSNRERNIVRDSAWREKRDNKMPAQFQPLLKSPVQSVSILSSRLRLYSHRRTLVNLLILIAFNSITVKWTSYSLWGISNTHSWTSKVKFIGQTPWQPGDKGNQCLEITPRNPSTGNLTQHNIISWNKKNSCVQVYPKYCGHCKLKRSKPGRCRHWS